LAWLIKKSKNVTMERAGEEILRLLSCRKSVHFFGKRCCEKCTGKSNAGKEKQKRVNSEN
jgi:hypothetical protein